MRSSLSHLSHRACVFALAAVCGVAIRPAMAGSSAGQAEIVTAPKSGALLISGSRIAISGALALDPCEERLVISIGPQVKVAALDGLKGTLRAGGEIPAGVKPATHYVVEGALTVRDSASRTVGTNLTGFLVTSPAKVTSETSVQGKLALDWDGTRWSADGVTVAGAGSHTADAEVVLLRVMTQGSKLLREELLDRAVVRTNLQVVQAVPQIDECRAWAQVAPGLGKGTNHQVLVHGQSSFQKPWISWRRNRPVAIFGDMGRPATSSTSRLDTVAAFLKAHQNLFGITNAAVVGTLRQGSENPDPDGTVRLRLYQTTTVGTSTQVRAAKGRMTAVFDSTGELVFLGGRLLENLPLTVPAARLTSADAVSSVAADLTAKGSRAGRDVRYLDPSLVGNGTAAYELAFRVGVGPADRSVSTEPPPARDHSFEYFVSAGSGRILRIRDRTYPSLRPVVTVSDLDPGLVYGTGGEVDAGVEGAIDRAAEIRINDPTGNIFERDRYWLEDDDAPSGIVSQTFIDTPYDSEPRWYSSDLDGVPADMGSGSGPRVATQHEIRKAFTAYRQVQLFWDRFGDHFVPSSSELDLLVQYGDLDESLGGQYSVLFLADNEIRMSTDWLDISLSSLPLYAAAHETFHHLDWQTVDLEHAEDDGDYRMPGAIKEGMANAAMDWTDPHPLSNVQSVGSSFFLCLFGSGGNAEKLRTCLDLADNVFRKAGADPFARPFGMSGARNPVLPWPDCRTSDPAEVSPFGCGLVLIPANATSTSFKFRDQPNDAQSQYLFLQQVMLDLWETAASVAAASGTPDDGKRFADDFPNLAIKGFLMLDDEANFVELRNALRAASAMSAVAAPFSPQILAAVDDVFARHGVDSDLEGFCAGDQNDDFCH